MKNPRPRLLFRIGLRVALLVLMLPLIWFTGRAGFASLLTAYAAKSNVIASADAAVRLGPKDPEAHFVRAALLETENDFSGSINEIKVALSLRPDDYVLWQSLARVSELNGDRDGAGAAARQAIPLAPFYAQPHWQLGNLLVRQGQRDEGFKELSLAAESNPALAPAVIDLVWQAANGDAQFVMRTLRPQRPESYQALARYFLKKKAFQAAAAMLVAGGSISNEDRRTYVAELIAAGHFDEAYSVWSFSRPQIPKVAVGLIRDPGFEQEQDLDQPGFDWHSEVNAASVALSLDSDKPKDGRSSLRIDFKGASDAARPVISQLVLVEPRTRYHLRFSYRTEDIVSGSQPVFTIIDALENRSLGRSILSPANSAGWTDASIDFDSGETTRAILIALQRDGCAGAECPIFGRLWLDNFSLQKQ
jgi:hypothetical protein